MAWLLAIPLFAIYAAFGLCLFAFAAYIADEWFGVTSPGLGDDLDHPGFCAAIAVIWPMVISLLALIAVVYLVIQALAWFFTRWASVALFPQALYDWLRDNWGKKK